jgi:hypothetical protein
MYGLGTEALPLTTPQGLQRLGRSAGTVFGLAVYGLIWWDVRITLKLLRVQSDDVGG